MATHSTFLPGESQGPRSLVDCTELDLAAAAARTQIKKLDPWGGCCRGTRARGESCSLSQCDCHTYIFTRPCTYNCSLIAWLAKNPPARQGTRLWSPGWEDPLEKGTAPHSRFLAWRIPWTMGWQRVRYNWATITCTLTTRVTNSDLPGNFSVLTLKFSCPRKRLIPTPTPPPTPCPRNLFQETWVG